MSDYNFQHCVKFLGNEYFKLHMRLVVHVNFHLKIMYATPGKSLQNRDKFVYVIGLHAVQFGNNWMKKIPRTAKIESNYFQIGQACSPLTY